MDVTETYRDTLIRELARPLIDGDVDIDSMHPPSLIDVSEALEEEALSFFSGVSRFELKSTPTKAVPKRWFDTHDFAKDGSSREGCLNVAQCVEDQLGLHQKFTVKDAKEDIKLPKDYSKSSLRNYLNALAKSTMFDKEVGDAAGGSNTYRMVSTWEREVDE